MKTIIIYATKHGTTEKSAKLLNEKLGGGADIVNIMTDKLPSLSGYDTVILGGSVYMGMVQKKLTEYAAEHLTELKGKKVGLYLCAGSPQIEARQKELETAYPAELYSHATAKSVFGSEINFDKLGRIEKLIMKMVTGNSKNVSDLSIEAIDSFANLILI